MTDIVEWLKWYATESGIARCKRAADEIERLRADKAELVEALEKLHECIDPADFLDGDPVATIIAKHKDQQQTGDK